jgi:hypothetical protein
MKRLSLYAFLIFISSFALADEFNGAALDSMWSVRDPAGKGDYRLADGKLILDLAANADMWVQGTDGGVMFLLDPPAQADFSIELSENVAVDGTQPPACQAGIVFFNEQTWAYSAWGPYNAGQDIRLEDCVGADYRWRDQAQIGIDPADVAVDEDVYLKVIKTGDELEFLTKGSASEDWVSAGVDTKLGPHYTPGNYQIGIIAKSWGGSVASTFEFESFDVLGSGVTAVEAVNKLATTWGKLKVR